VTRRPIPIAAGLVLVALVAVLAGSQLGLVGGASSGSSPSSPSGSAAGALTGAASSQPTIAPAQTDETETPEPVASATPGAPATPAPIIDVPIVPVTSFRSTATTLTRKELDAVIAGTSIKYDTLALVDDDAIAVLDALGLKTSDQPEVVLFDDVPSLKADLARNRKRLAFLRADAVGPEARALGWGGKALFGVDRVKRLADWPLTARLPAPAAADAYDPATTWTLFAGGDILLDRGVYLTLKAKGANYAFDGGTADITGRCKDCSSMGWDLPYTKRTGNAGAFRHLIKGADIAAANFENPAPDKPRFHASGTSFSADPRYIDGLAAAGIDYLSLANNHIRDAGGAGLLQTIKNVKKRGIAVSGAGKNLAAARKPAILEAGGTRVAILGYDAIAGGYHATATRVGSAGLSAKAVKKDVAAARKAGADLVIVYPHWGTEYNPKPFANQRKLAEMIIDNGADMVIGNHAHWAGAMEVYKGKPIWFALGNFVFDQTWSEPTMEGITLELTFHRTTLVQVRMRPHIILDKAQPNFLDPAGAGKFVMGQVYTASKGLLPW
jgi:poly-gamma-glutamate capsule biosynthesis protein CapA/YwtB (metallophosphatase superfamily)